MASNITDYGANRCSSLKRRESNNFDSNLQGRSVCTEARNAYVYKTFTFAMRLRRRISIGHVLTEQCLDVDLRDARRGGILNALTLEQHIVN